MSQKDKLPERKFVKKSREENRDLTAANFLRDKRSRLKKTAQSVGSQIGVTPSAIYAWETGRNGVPRALLEKLAIGYELSEDEKSALDKMILSDRVRTYNVLRPTPNTEAKLFYQLIKLSKEAREKVYKAVEAYEAMLGNDSK